MPPPNAHQIREAILSQTSMQQPARLAVGIAGRTRMEALGLVPEAVPKRTRQMLQKSGSVVGMGPAKSLKEPERALLTGASRALGGASAWGAEAIDRSPLKLRGVCSDMHCIL